MIKNLTKKNVEYLLFPITFFTLNNFLIFMLSKKITFKFENIFINLFITLFADWNWTYLVLNPWFKNSFLSPHHLFSLGFHRFSLKPIILIAIMNLLSAFHFYLYLKLNERHILGKGYPMASLLTFLLASLFSIFLQGPF